MPVQLALSAVVADGCGEVALSDVSVLDGVTRAQVIGRNLSFVSPCGDELLSGGVAARSCLVANDGLQVTQLFDLSAITSAGNVTIRVNSLLGPDGANVLATPIVIAPNPISFLPGQIASLALALAAPLSAAGISAALGQQGLSLSAALAASSYLGPLSGTYQVGAGAQIPFSSTPSGANPIAVGTVVSLGICGTTLYYTVTDSDVVAPSRAISLLQSIELTSKNIATQLWGLLQPKLEKLACDCAVSVGFGDCSDCLISFESDIPGLPLPEISLGSTGVQPLAVLAKTANTSNWDIERSFVFSLGPVVTPKTAWVFSGLQVDGSNALLIPFTAPTGVSYTDQVAAVADHLSTLGIGEVSLLSPTSIRVLSSKQIGALSGTDSLVAFAFSPSVSSQAPSIPDQRTAQICGDGVYLATLTYVVTQPGFAQARVELPASFTSAAVQIAGPAPFPSLLAVPIVDAGDAIQSAALAAQLIQAYLDQVVALPSGSIRAFPDGSGAILLQVSLSYLASLSPAWGECAGVPSGLTLAGGTTISGGSFGPGTILQFNLSPCVAGGTETTSQRIAVLSLCQTKCKLGEIVSTEVSSRLPADQWLPTSTQVQTAMLQAQHFFDQGDYLSATRMIRKAEGITKQPNCGPCSDGLVWATPFASTSKKPCNC
jgi:hypothetical protein